MGSEGGGVGGTFVLLVCFFFLLVWGRKLEWGKERGGRSMKSWGQGVILFYFFLLMWERRREWGRGTDGSSEERGGLTIV